ncbi:glycosyltransferase family A protein [Escherichia coli]|uniref:glycosyltransferase family A protein n=1 Tax=Escherichia coli TaxID=562 RepID=UPI0012612700|nr:glycosyltransferase family A protein [Escherichia coli]EFJ2910225.1 glycosyltransferase family 2 protein [Escherichia coli]EGF1580541.1 glycosyltransferase family 2 protein [Escherichia coli]EHW5959467.1 glycosyltransferase family 2 protein [Escherichia coli]EHW7848544.1 glycosyltransferase family 2 protein [Escherichia coli]EHX1015243.1 glycosyltransferase family 2 protein [Escherichia coli]
MNPIPIFIMTRNDGVYLQDCLNSILKNTVYPFNLYVIDNNSSDKLHLKILEEYKTRQNVNVIRNKSNLWVLGLNKHLEKVKKESDSSYFVLTDGDIIFPEPGINGCWLTQLVIYMDTYKCIGKIGMSLNWDSIRDDPFYEEIYDQEKKLYNNNKKIENLYISPVDTTAAIYRWDWSIEGYKFYPDHIRYLRPELYSCRTPKEFNAKHLGWLVYKNNNGQAIKKLDEKIKCFTLVGADIKKTQLKKASLKVRMFNSLCGKPIKYFWSMRRILYTIFYTLKKGIWLYDNH